MFTNVVCCVLCSKDVLSFELVSIFGQRLFGAVFACHDYAYKDGDAAQPSHHGHALVEHNPACHDGCHWAEVNVVGRDDGPQLLGDDAPKGEAQERSHYSKEQQVEQDCGLCQSAEVELPRHEKEDGQGGE